MFQNLGRGNKHGRNDKEIPKISVLNDDISRLESMLHTRYTHVTHTLHTRYTHTRDTRAGNDNFRSLASGTLNLFISFDGCPLNASIRYTHATHLTHLTHPTHLTHTAESVENPPTFFHWNQWAIWKRRGGEEGEESVQCMQMSCWLICINISPFFFSIIFFFVLNYRSDRRNLITLPTPKSILW